MAATGSYLVAKSREPLPLADLIAWLGLLVGIISGWLYLAGWTYAYAYFDRFNLSLGLVESSGQELLVYGFLALFGLLWVLPASAGIVLALASCIFLRQRLPYWVVMGSTGLLTLAAFYMAHVAGESVGLATFAAQRTTDYPAYPRVAIGLAASIDSDSLLPKLARNDCARLLVARPRHIVLIRPKLSAPALPLQAIVVPTSSIEWLRITDIYKSCE